MKKSIIVMAIVMVSLVSFAQKTKEQNVPQKVKNTLLLGNIQNIHFICKYNKSYGIFF